MQFIGLLLLMAGFVVGLGALTVIDIHGFLGRHSPYWTEATTRAHKVTKPLIWSGMMLAIVGGILFYLGRPYEGIVTWLPWIALSLIMNGSYLSFVVSPYLLRQEKQGHAGRLLPPAMQRGILVSFIISATGWWSAFALIVHDISTKIVW